MAFLTRARLVVAAALFMMVACGGGGSTDSSSSATSSPQVNAAPVANAGPGQNVITGTVVRLNGSASFDASGNPLVYFWTLTSKPVGSSTVLVGATSALPTFTADLSGTYVASLVVYNARGTSTASTVTITATVGNVAPTASAGPNQNVSTGGVVRLNGSLSIDANGDPLTYIWTLTSKPIGSSAALAGATSALPTFTADLAGTYVASLVVNDGKVSSTVSTVTVTATVGNAAPVANAGTSQNVITGAFVALNGSASTDANSDPLTYSWTLTSKPIGSSAALAGATSALPTFTADLAGNYVASLVVNDGKVSSAVSTVTVIATVGNAAPVSNAGPSQNVITGAVVTLNGSASSDANSDPLTYSWTLTSRPVGSSAALAGATSASPTFTADLAGTYVASLVVNDGILSSAASTVTVTATVGNAAPVANAGSSQNVVTGSVVTLNGSASSDANSDPLTYSWTLTSRPGGSSAALAGATSSSPTFTADLAGTYVASLLVNDGKVSSTVSTVTVTAVLQALTLYEVQDSFIGGSTENLVSWPYSISSNTSATTTCVGSCPTFYTVGKFKLKASIGGSYTITNLVATNLTTGSPVVPTFGGITNNQVIPAGQTVAFDLRSAFTNSQTVLLRYSFTVSETGDTFTYTVSLRTSP